MNLERRSALQEFQYGDVTLSPGPHQAQLEQTHGILMGMDEDSLLRPFRMAAGLPAPGNDLGGWYSAPRFLAETFGQWISALSRYYAAKRDEPTRAKLERLMSGYSETLSFSRKMLEANGNPLYLHDKLVVGISDVALSLGEERAKELLCGFADATGDFFQTKHTAKSWPKPDVEAESSDSLSGYSYAETYLTAWQRSAEPRYLTLAKRDLQSDFFERLSRGENVLSTRHVYGHINALCGAAKAYLAFGEDACLKAAINGLAFAEQQSYVTGGYGPEELFLPRKEVVYPNWVFPALQTIGDSILREHRHFETGCGAYAHMKLTRYLLCITRDSRYGDSMERVMYNTALGALPLNRFGKAFYHSNYRRRARKEYFDGYDHSIVDGWPCCSGTLPQLAADYHINAFFKNGDSLYINLYIPSAVRWSDGKSSVLLRQSGDYPFSNCIDFTLEASRPTVLTLHFRIPIWAQGAQLSVNGSSVTEILEPGKFAAVQRKWRSGDRVRLILPMRVELVPADNQHLDMVAVRCGPVALFAIGDDLPKLSRKALLCAKQLSPGASEWLSDGIRFLPWWILKKETYTTYHEVGE